MQNFFTVLEPVAVRIGDIRARAPPQLQRITNAVAIDVGTFRVDPGPAVTDAQLDNFHFVTIGEAVAVAVDGAIIRVGATGTSIEHAVAVKIGGRVKGNAFFLSLGDTPVTRIKAVQRGGQDVEDELRRLEHRLGERLANRFLSLLAR